MNQENSRETNKEERKYFCCFWFSKKAKEEANIYNINTILVGFIFGKSFNDRDFAMVPLAWTTHVQGRPQLLHYSSFSFTFPNFM